MTFVDEIVAPDGRLEARVESRLADYFDTQRLRAKRLSTSSPALAQFEPLWVHAAESARGGKKLRPALVLGAYRALLTAPGASIRDGSACDDEPATEESAISVATAFELLHTAFLLHDDVIDGDTVRRGRPNLIGRFAQQARDLGADQAASTRWGEACAVLAGDLLIHGAQTMVDRAGLSEGMRVAIQEVLDDALFVTAAGEQGDVGLAVGVVEPELQNVLGITRAKTAYYSFSDPLRVAGILANADDEAIAALQRIGSLIGAAFQLRDDVLGVFGDEDVTGKSSTGDLRNGKVTALVAFAASGSAASGSADGQGWAQMPAQDARAELQRSGALDAVERLIQQHRAEASAVLHDARLPEATKELLSDFLSRATERDS